MKYLFPVSKWLINRPKMGFSGIDFEKDGCVSILMELQR